MRLAAIAMVHTTLLNFVLRTESIQEAATMDALNARHTPNHNVAPPVTVLLLYSTHSQTTRTQKSGLPQVCLARGTRQLVERSTVKHRLHNVMRFPWKRYRLCLANYPS